MHNTQYPKHVPVIIGDTKFMGASGPWSVRRSWYLEGGCGG